MKLYYVAKVTPKCGIPDMDCMMISGPFGGWAAARQAKEDYVKLGFDPYDYQIVEQIVEVQ